MDEQLEELYKFSKDYMPGTPDDFNEFSGWVAKNGTNIRAMMDAINPGMSSAYEDVFNPKKKKYLYIPFTRWRICCERC